MKKRLFSLLLILPLLFGCSFRDYKWSEHTTLNDSFGFVSKKLRNVNISFDYENLESVKNRLNNDVLTKVDISKVKKDFTEFSNLTDKLSKKSTYISTYYYMSPSKYRENYQKLLETQQDISTFYSTLLQNAAKSSDDIKKYFFGTTDENTINNKLNKSEISKELSILDNKMTKISDAYAEFDALNYPDNELLFNEGIARYPEYVALANQYAKLNDYDNYLSYSYKEIFGRDYTPDEGLQFAKNFKETFSHLNLNNKKINLIDDGSVDFINANLIDKVVFNKVGNPAAGLMDSYANYMGGKFKKTYNNLWNNGYYCFSDAEDSMGTAYVSCDPSLTHQVVFYSASNQNVCSVLHEFGHYFAIENNNKTFKYSYDILETHSQANEFLFLNYLKNNYNNKFIKLLSDKKILESVYYLANFSYIIEVENYVFRKESITSEELKNYVSYLNNEYTFLEIPFNPYYWMYPCICSPCYYISYGTSSLEAMQFNTMELSKAKNTYIEFCLDSKDKTMEEKWTSCGLSSPFNEESFQNLANYIRRINL